jgi:hypothetical protein
MRDRCAKMRDLAHRSRIPIEPDLGGIVALGSVHMAQLLVAALLNEDHVRISLQRIS